MLFGVYRLLQGALLQAYSHAFVFMAARMELAQVLGRGARTPASAARLGRALDRARPAMSWVNRGPVSGSSCRASCYVSDRAQ